MGNYRNKSQYLIYHPTLILIVFSEVLSKAIYYNNHKVKTPGN